MVGAVVVRDGAILAKGFHRKAGEAHAEIDALRKLEMRAPGATLYVTLEPCSHQGRTGPCADAVISSGIRRVVVGCLDENPKVAGRGVRKLKAAGIEVQVGCLAEDCRRLNQPFFTWITKNRPQVTLKVAATLDGFIGDGRDDRRNSATRWITSEESRGHVQTIRAQHDAILVGVGTIQADNPRLTLRLRKQRPFPLQRIILDSELRSDPRARVFQQRGTPQPLIIAARPRIEQPAFAKRKRRLSDLGADVQLVPADAQGRPKLTMVMSLLAEREIQSLLVEGGSHIHGSFISAGLVDRILFYFAPSLVGAGVPIAMGKGLGFDNPLRLTSMAVVPLGGDLLISAEVAGKNRPKRGR
jgi:diaminohydroxyphosphoribosylaminopyrimidine deaminase/5-amino-6-(5-phosphoribosylamino)uracil reductase